MDGPPGGPGGHGGHGDSDWDDFDDPPRKRGKVALLAAVAAVVVLGGTVAGIQLVNRSADEVAASCAPGADCAKVTPSNPPPSSSAPADPEPTEETEPVEDTEIDEPAAAEPTTPVTETSEPAPRRTQAARRPSPKPTRTKEAPEPEISDQATPPPDVVEEEQTETEDPQELGVPTPERSNSQPDPPSDPSLDDAVVNGVSGGAVRVGFDLVESSVVLYTAEVSVRNATSASVSGMRVSIPVGGVVSEVEAAEDVEWSQEGDTLVLSYAEEMPAGEEREVTFTALGAAETPTTCEATSARCELT